MQTDRFRELVDAPGPFATVYYDDSHNTEDASAVSDLTVRAVVEQLRERSADESLIRAVETALDDSRPPVGRSGRVVIANPNGVIVDEHLLRPAVSTEVRVSELPYLVPIVEHGVERVDYAVALVDHAGADLTVHRVDHADSASSVDGGGFPVHKASGAETSGYGDPQPRAEEAARKNMRAAAQELERVVDTDHVGLVFIAGDDQARAELRRHLTERVLEAAVDVEGVTRTAESGTDHLRERIEEEFARRQLAALDSAVQRFHEQEGTGRSAQGMADVTAALRSGNVETLIVGDTEGRTVAVADGIVAPDSDTLSEYGTVDGRVAPADEALPAAAVRIGAAIVRTDERFDPDDGIAAVLRYDEFSSADPDGR